MCKDKDMLWIKNPRLEVGILKPRTKYKRARFDWTGFIYDITLDGDHHFCVTHSEGDAQELLGRGLCNEFGMVIPIGREPEVMGDGSGRFPKIGVGLLPDDVDERSELVPLETMTPYPKSYIQGDDSITFTTEPIEYDGYAVRLQKTISICENSIIIDYELENTGSKEINTEEYCHNFVRIDDHSMGPDYELSTKLKIPEDMKADELSSAMDKTDNGLTWPKKPEEVYFFRVEQDQEEVGYKWQLTHKPTGVAMIEEGNFKAFLFAVWGLEDVVSPEVFIKIDLAPGKKMQWQRKYTFIA